MASSFIRKIQNFIFHKKLFAKGAKILIGCSGGPDSICLAKVLLALRDKQDLKLSLLHVNYELRGKDSEEDEQFVRDFAKENELEFKVVKFPKGKKRKFPEDQLRNFRYEQFEKQRVKKEFDLVAVGHNLDDQAETFLMNALRGSGLKGLGAMKVKSGNIIRPLLATEKKDILEYLKNAKQKFRLDRTNFSDEFTRNKIRNKLIPFLEKQLNPNVKQSLFRLTENVQGQMEIVEEWTEKSYNRVISTKGNQLVFDLKKLQKMSLGQQAAIFRKTVSELKGDLKELGSEHFFEFSKIAQSTKPKNQKYSFLGLALERKSDKITIKKIKK